MSIKAMLQKITLRGVKPLAVSEWEQFIAVQPHEVTFQQWTRARRAWNEFENARNRRRVSFEELCQWSTPRSMCNPHTKTYELRATPRTYQIMQLCLSPHSHTLLKAWWIREHNTKRKRHGTEA